MSPFVLPPISLVSFLAGWLNQEQQKVLEYLQEEKRVLKVQLGQLAVGNLTSCGV